MKKCTCCKQIKDYSHFYKRKQSKDGYDYYCKECWIPAKIDKTRVKKYNCKNDYFNGKQLSLLITNARKRANIKKLDYELSAANLAPLLLEFCTNNYHSWESSHPFKPSVDRIDSNKGYTLDNIQIVWAIENHCKNTYTNEIVLQFCKLKLKIE